MKSYFIVTLLMLQSCFAFAQLCHTTDKVHMIHFPLTENDTSNVFYYINNELIPEVDMDMVDPDSIIKIDLKKEESAVFITVSPETHSQIKSKVNERYKDIAIEYEPICEFPGGSGMLKEWIDGNIRVPEGLKGIHSVVALFTVQPDGSITDARMLKPSKNDAVNKEALRLVNTMPNFRVKYFTPCKTPVKMALPISFREPGLILIR